LRKVKASVRRLQLTLAGVEKPNADCNMESVADAQLDGLQGSNHAGMIALHIVRSPTLHLHFIRWTLESKPLLYVRQYRLTH
jgi:hypothetical protein